MTTHPELPLTAKIVEWKHEKGYGFLQVGKGRLFLHWRDFAERHKRPAVGDLIRFTGGVDAQGRRCAKNAVHVNDGGHVTALAVLLLTCLLVLPRRRTAPARGGFPLGRRLCLGDQRGQLR